LLEARRGAGRVAHASGRARGGLWLPVHRQLQETADWCMGDEKHRACRCTTSPLTTSVLAASRARRVTHVECDAGWAEGLQSPPTVMVGGWGVKSKKKKVRLQNLGIQCMQRMPLSLTNTIFLFCSLQALLQGEVLCWPFMKKCQALYQGHYHLISLKDLPYLHLLTHKLVQYLWRPPRLLKKMESHSSIPPGR
jgi:hypothetical protein